MSTNNGNTARILAYLERHGCWQSAAQINTELRLFGIHPLLKHLADADQVERKRDGDGAWQYRIPPAKATEAFTRLIGRPPSTPPFGRVYHLTEHRHNQRGLLPPGPASASSMEA